MKYISFRWLGLFCKLQYNIQGRHKDLNLAKQNFEIFREYEFLTGHKIVAY